MRELDADEGCRTGTFGAGGIFLSRGAEEDERSWNHLGHDTAGARQAGAAGCSGPSFGMRDTGLEVSGKRDYPCGQGWICSCPVSLCAWGSAWWLWWHSGAIPAAIREDPVFQLPQEHLQALIDSVLHL